MHHSVNLARYSLPLPKIKMTKNCREDTNVVTPSNEMTTLERDTYGVLLCSGERVDGWYQ